MPRKLTDYDYLVIIQNRMHDDPSHIITTDNEEELAEISGSIILPSPTNPEIEIIKRDNFDKLSEETKELIFAILDSPSEIIELFQTPLKRDFSKKKIKETYTTIWKSRLIVEKVFEEIKKWVDGL